MIDIVGNIKVDESKPERIKYLLACIRSYRFLVGRCKFVLCLNQASDYLFNLVKGELLYFKDFALIGDEFDALNYGKRYCHLLKECNNDYVINFMEDQFMVLDEVNYLEGILNSMKALNTDIMKSSFHTVEYNSIFYAPIHTVGPDWLKAGEEYGDYFLNTKQFHDLYQRYYEKRYYIGCNFITTRDFAIKFWNRECGSRPHGYEIVGYSDEWQHKVMFPRQEIQAAIDDDHGEPNTCLLKRDNCEKWNNIWAEVNS